MKGIRLLIIDPQNDFCDLPAAACPSGEQPALPVAGAHADMQRLAALIEDGGAALSAIAVTLDTHQRLDIAHPSFWQGAGCAGVAPFTPITARQVRSGEFAPRDPSAVDRALAYLDELEARGRYTLMVWPVHCELGSWGHAVHAQVRAAYNAWEETRQRPVLRITKGANPWTEHYSAILAEVPDPVDPSTQLNRALVDWAAGADLLLVAGEASSHCVKATTEHLVQNLPPQAAYKLVLLTDCMSPVTGFGAQHQAFLEDMRARGVRLASSAELTAQLQTGA